MALHDPASASASTKFYSFRVQTRLPDTALGVQQSTKNTVVSGPRCFRNTTSGVGLQAITQYTNTAPASGLQSTNSTVVLGPHAAVSAASAGLHTVTSQPRTDVHLPPSNPETTKPLSTPLRPQTSYRIFEEEEVTLRRYLKPAVPTGPLPDDPRVATPLSAEMFPSTSFHKTNAMLLDPESTFAVSHSITPTSDFPPLPRSVVDLSPAMLTTLSRLLAYSPNFPRHLRQNGISIPASKTQFREWENMYRCLLFTKKYCGLWEYDGQRSLLIIRCMPTPIHDSVIFWASGSIQEGFRLAGVVGGLPRSGVHIYHNSDIDVRTGGQSGRRLADLAIKVKLHGDGLLMGMVLEVGFTQTWLQLKETAHMWLHEAEGKGIKVHLVMAVHVSEGKGPQFYCDENGNDISRSQARSKMFDWPSPWFAGRGVVEEVQRRTDMGVGMEAVEEALKLEIEEELLKRDKEAGGRSMPALLGGLSAKVVVFQKEIEKEIDNDGDNEAENNNGIAVDQDENGSLTDSDSSTHDSALHLRRIYSNTILQENQVCPSLHLHPLTLTIAHLYGPIPPCANATPADILSLMPAHMRPHADKKIEFSLEELAENILSEDEAMRQRRAAGRAKTIVENAWKVVKAAEQQKGIREKREREIGERDARAKRKSLHN